MRGKIGVYGRSLGGVVACHIAAKFPEKIDLLIADRTFAKLGDLSKRKFPGEGTRWVLKIVSCDWETNNDINFYNAKCYKILTMDPKDDVID